MAYKSAFFQSTVHGSCNIRIRKKAALLKTIARSARGVAQAHQIYLRTDIQERLIALHARQHEGKMKTRTHCVYNLTRESFLSLGVTPADTLFSRLKGLIGRVKLRVDEGLWIVPSCGIHTLGVLFPIDVVYLDDNHQVIHVIEHFPTFRISPLKPQASSVLELPIHTIYSSQTQIGDQLLICAVDDIANRFNKGSSTSIKNQPPVLDSEQEREHEPEKESKFF